MAGGSFGFSGGYWFQSRAKKTTPAIWASSEINNIPV
jgi:hypothetical protein